MKINPFEIAKMAKKAFDNKDLYKAKAEELRANPLVGISGNAKSTFDVETNRIAKIEYEGIDSKALDQIKNSVNDAFDQSDSVWMEFEK